MNSVAVAAPESQQRKDDESRARGAVRERVAGTYDQHTTLWTQPPCSVSRVALSETLSAHHEIRYAQKWETVGFGYRNLESIDTLHLHLAPSRGAAAPTRATAHGATGSMPRRAFLLVAAACAPHSAAALYGPPRKVQIIPSVLP